MSSRPPKNSARSKRNVAHPAATQSEPPISPSGRFASPEIQAGLFPTLHSLDLCRLSLTCTDLRSSIPDAPEFAARVVVDVGPVKELGHTQWAHSLHCRPATG